MVTNVVHMTDNDGAGGVEDDDDNYDNDDGDNDNRNLKQDDGDGSENVSRKMNLRSLKLNRIYLDPLNM